MNCTSAGHSWPQGDVALYDMASVHAGMDATEVLGHRPHGLMILVHYISTPKLLLSSSLFSFLLLSQVSEDTCPDNLLKSPAMRLSPWRLYYTTPTR